MHRSGTSMLSRLLKELGVFMGADCARGTAESIFFRKLNIALLDQLGATWHQPGSAATQLSDPLVVERLSRSAVRRCRACSMLGYRGVENAIRDRRLAIESTCWGWKDPRNSLTLPVWMSVFPQARIVHIVRNGVDVAGSLIARDRRLHSSHWSAIRRRAVAQLIPWRRTDFMRSAFRDVGEAFDLWMQYLAAIEQHRMCVPGGQWLEIRYEDLLDQSVPTLTAICKYAGLDQSGDDIARVGSTVRNERRFALLQNAELSAFYETVATDRFMQRHGYDDLCAGSIANGHHSATASSGAAA